VNSLLTSNPDALERSAAMHTARGRRNLFKSTGPRQDRRRGAPGILNEEGSELVETALTYGILLSLLFGLMQVTLGVYAYHYVSFAAREATRWAIVRGVNCTGLTGCDAANSDIQTHLQNLGYPGINTANLTTTTTWSTQTWDTSGGPGTDTAVLTPCATAPCNVPGNQVKVQVQYDLPLNIPFVPSATIHIKSTSAMMISQ
jgi:Flp pilus assembly protein TadG